MSTITQGYDSEWLFIDSIAVKAYQRSSGVVSHQDKTISNSSKIYLVVDAIRVKSNSKSSIGNMDWFLYRYRHSIENAFARLKYFTGVTTRYDKLKASYEAAIILACTYIRLSLI